MQNRVIALRACRPVGVALALAGIVAPACASSPATKHEDDSAAAATKTPAAATCDAIPIRDVSASASDENTAGNVADEDLETRWSAQGKGVTLTLDVGKVRALCGLEVAWYRGDARVAQHEIAVSSDGVSYQTVFDGASSGRTADFERYAFAAPSARYVRLTGKGNSENPWTSILEVRVLGGALAGAPDGGAPGTGTDAGKPPPPPPPPSGTLFEKPMPWTKRVDGLAPSPASGRITRWLDDAGGWGSNGRLRIDFTINVLTANASTPFRSFTKTGDFFSPDCDYIPFPVPAGGALEAESGYSCTNDGDCHLIVVDPAKKKLYEMWRADLGGGTFRGGCSVMWDLTQSYPDTLRGEGCTSADAGGFPLTAMLFSADEVAAGEIPHAIRFILPNDRIRKNVYVRPATHSTSPTSGGPDAPPYGVRMRLRKDYPLDSLPTEGARVVARALQRYGMILSDGGVVTLTGTNDRFTKHKWKDVGVHEGSVQQIKVTDMEVVDMGAPIEWSGDCTRN